MHLIIHTKIMYVALFLAHPLINSSLKNRFKVNFYHVLERPDGTFSPIDGGKESDFSMVRENLFFHIKNGWNFNKNFIF